LNFATSLGGQAFALKVSVQFAKVFKKLLTKLSPILTVMTVLKQKRISKVLQKYPDD
jgi:hypothetical protein